MLRATNGPKPGDLMTNPRINIGCGMTPTEGWRNFDNSPGLRLARVPLLPGLLRRVGLINDSQYAFIRFARTNRIEYCDASKRIPLEDVSAKVIYSSHMLEHLTPDGARSFLREAKRVLRPGGIIRLSVPDLEKPARQYLEDGDADAFIASTLLAAPGRQGIAGRMKKLAAGPRHHRWMYDGRSLCRLLNSAGFFDARILPAGETTIPDPSPLDLRERESESVYAEAVKKV